MPDQCYFNGEFWQALQDTNPGESPATNPEKWARIRIPKEWRKALAQLAYANLLKLDGQTDKAGSERADALGQVDLLIHREAQAEQERMRPNVRTRQAW